MTRRWDDFQRRGATGTPNKKPVKIGTSRNDRWVPEFGLLAPVDSAELAASSERILAITFSGG